MEPAAASRIAYRPGRWLRAVFIWVAAFAAIVVHANTATTPVARTEAWVKRHEGFVEEAKRGGVDVLFLGDSITDDWRKYGRAIWDAHFAPLRAANFGIDGDRTQNVLWRIEHGTLDGFAPKVVVLLIGTNNTGLEKNGTPRNSTAEAIEGIEAVIHAVQQKLPQSKLLVLGILPRGPRETAHRIQIREINAAIETYATGVGARFLDIGGVFMSADASISPHVMPDLLHPNEAGYALWAAAIGPTVTELLGGAPAVAPRFSIVKDVAYLAEGRTEKLDLFLPTAAATKPRPAVVVIHGGGWTMGDKADAREREIAGTLAAEGYVTASINYRLGAGAWPQNLRDCRNAVRFLRQHAAEYNIDPAKIAVQGNSAGGHLAMMTAFTANEPDDDPAPLYPGVSSAVAAVVDFYGRPDPATCLKPGPDGAPTSQLAFTPGLAEMLGCTLEQNPARWKEASPLAHVTKDTPPVLIVQGLLDPSVDYTQPIKLANALRAVGVDHELILLEGIGHGFDFENWQGKPMRDLRPAVLQFLARTVKK